MMVSGATVFQPYAVQPKTAEAMSAEIEEKFNRSRLTSVVVYASLKHAREAGLSEEDALRFAVNNLVEQNDNLMKMMLEEYWKRNPLTVKEQADAASVQEGR